MAEWTLVDELQLPPINISRASLLIAKNIAYPNLDLPAYMLRLDELAGNARQFVPDGGSPQERGFHLAEFLFIREQFMGDEADYGNPLNSFLNELLDRRLGIPITLSILYMDIAGRLGINTVGIGLPGHFIVQIQHEGQAWMLDPFHGGRLVSEEDCARLVKSSTGYHGLFNPGWLQPVSPEAILTRVLNNLRINYVERRDWPKALAAIRQLRDVQPEAAEHIRDLGLVYFRQGSLRLAAHYLEDYLQRSPEAEDADTIRQGLAAALEQWARMN